jgi:hypothetical protein
VPNTWGYGKAYQIIAFATKGRKPRIFHRLRIDAPLGPEYRYEREHGMFVTDVWDDIRELTSGYFAGEEALSHPDGTWVCTQQAPIRFVSAHPFGIHEGRRLGIRPLCGDWDDFGGRRATTAGFQKRFYFRPHDSVPLDRSCGAFSAGVTGGEFFAAAGGPNGCTF